MAGASTPLDITIDDAEIKAGLAQLAAKLNDLRPFFNDVGETLLNSTRNRFRSQTAPDGAAWKPLSPAYAARKARNQGKVLTLYGHLRGTLVKQATADSLRIGTPLIYGAVHQFGAAKGSFGTVVARINAYSRRGKGSRDAKGRFTAGQTTTVRAHTRPMRVPWGDIPARPFLGLSEDDRQDLLAALNAYLSPP